MHLSTLLLPLTFALAVAGGQTGLPFHPPSKSHSTTTPTVPAGPVRSPIHYTYPDHPTIILPRGEIPRPTPIDQFARPGVGAGRFGGSFVEKHNEAEPQSYSEIITWAPSTTGVPVSLPTSIVIDTSSYSHGTITPSQTHSAPGSQSTPASHSTSDTHSAPATQSTPASHSTSTTQPPSPSTSHTPFTNSTTIVNSLHSSTSFTTSTTIVSPSPTSSTTRPSTTTSASASPTSSGSTLKWNWTLAVCGFMGVFVFGML
ncbi:hypothetical protein HYFRA_00009916 [Hymenoscyphus fraxineus]|uniref:Uncharacterized protein n=1 Tax=Hymenoscyphus fraxineus TaxID=746836 RepID=A0A9N9L3T4_9HELO|nr:hypothetical protein HYFRA_00009916 [Hymenoscyphus fraxineus]